MTIVVTLPSGRSEGLSLPLTSKVGDLKILAQRALGSRFLRLVTADGRVLADDETLQSLDLEDGCQVAAISLQAKVSATRLAFAFWCCGGDRIITWGNPVMGGDSSAVQDRLRSVQQVQGNNSAFAAILADGSVVTWGHPAFGGDSSEVQDQLQSVRQIVAAGSAFAAIHGLDQWLHGAILKWGEIAPQSKISFAAYSKFRLQASHLLQFLQMGQSFPGAIHFGVVTALKFKAS